MEDSHYGNAMTEIALALAMGFFSIMVLTMVSMGAGSGEMQTTTGAILAQPEKQVVQAAKIEVQSKDLVVVHHNGRFFDKQMNPLDPTSIQTSRRVLLALHPSLPISEALAARAKLNVKNLIVSTLDEQWIKYLKEKNHADQ
jgi:hypothetical protein